MSIVIFAIALIMTGCSKQETETVKTTTSNTETNKAKTQEATEKAPPATGTKLAVNTSGSKIEWEGKKVTGNHNGTIQIRSGELFVDGQKVTGGSFDIDFNTIEVLDLTDPEMNGKLTSHLKSDDFFAASSHPTGKFVITSVEQARDDKGNNMKITGNMTIKGITKPVSFPAKVTVDGNKVTATADFTIDRTLWDIKFRSGKFFQDLGDKLINDEFGIKLNLRAEA